MSATNIQLLPGSLDSDQESVERTREIVSATRRLLGDQDFTSVPADGNLAASDAALLAARRALVQRAGGAADRGGARATALILDSMAVQADVKDALIQQRADLVLGVQQAISTLRQATSTALLAQRAPIEANRIGFRRALFSQIEKGTWIARAGYSVADADFGEELVAVGRAYPRRLNGPLLESEMVRRGNPMIVSDAQSNPRVHLQLVRYSDTKSYVAAPVVTWGIPVAMVHADHDSDGGVDEFDRYILGVYTEGLGLALERTQLIERLQAVREATSEYFSGINAIADGFATDHPVAPRVPPVIPTEQHGERLTPREWEVLHHMASGKTNAQIATGLFVTEGTVKSHVKRILRKLCATNRTEAVARYHRLTVAAANKTG